MAPDRVQVPAPDLVKLVAPVLSAKMPAKVLAAVEVPVKVKVRGLVPVYPAEPVAESVNAPVPEASIAPPLAVIVNRRSVLVAAPVYFSMPPSKMRLPAALVEAPILLLVPPLARELTAKVPALMVVAPV